MFSFFVREWFGITIDYVLAGLAVALGVALAFGLPDAITATGIPPWAQKLLGILLVPLRYIGYALIALGLIKGAVTYGKSIGAADCISAAKVAELQQQNASLQRDLDAAKAVVAFKKTEAAELAQQKQDADQKVADYGKSIESLSAAVRDCRNATADDNRRLCDIIGNAAAGCKPAR